MIPEADKLIERAKSGEKLPTKERRHCIAYLMATAPEISNVEMSRWFQVSERQIRNDRTYIKEERAKLIREEDIGLVIADIALSFDNCVRDIERSSRHAKMGTQTYLRHKLAIFEMQLKRVQALQDLGYYPKNLGNMTIDKFEFKAFVGKDNNVSTRPTNLKFDEHGQVIEEEIVDAEFEQVEQKKLPAPESEETETIEQEQ